jgi:tetratricopeptide (TPR) repeat protein
MNRFCRIAHLLLVALLGLAVFAPGALAAAREKNEFPNATRKEHKADWTQSGNQKINAAYTAIDEADYETAKAKLQEVIDHTRSTNYERAIAYAGLSNIAYEEDNLTQAIEYDIKAIELDVLDNKSHFNTMFQLAQLYLMEERYEEALAAVDKWFAASGAQTDAAWSLRGNALYRMDRFADAAEAMQKAIALSPEPNDNYNQLLIASYYEGEQFDKAAQAAEAALAKDPSDKDTLMQLASIYTELEQDSKALGLLEGAYQKGMLTQERELRQLYQMYNYLEKPQQAAAVINDGLAKGVLKPSLETWKGLADSYALTENWDGAIDAYAKAGPFAQDGEMDFLRGQLLIQERDKFAEGKAAIQAALAKGKLKREGEAYILLGNAEYELGNEKAAIAAYQKARTFPSAKTMADAMLKNLGR